MQKASYYLSHGTRGTSFAYPDWQSGDCKAKAEGWRVRDTQVTPDDAPALAQRLAPVYHLSRPKRRARGGEDNVPQDE